MDLRRHWLRGPLRVRQQVEFERKVEALCDSRRLLSQNGVVMEAITRDPDVMHGVPVFRGTRVPVQTLFEYLESGESLDDFLEGFPTVDRALAVRVLEECKELRLARL